MDHLCYLDRATIDKMKMSDRIFLRMRRKDNKDEIWQVFKDDFVYLATKQRPKTIIYKARVLSAVKASLEMEQELTGSAQVCCVGRRRRQEQSIGLIEVLLLKRMSFKLESTNRLLQISWEPIGNIETVIQGGEMNENT